MPTPRRLALAAAFVVLGVAAVVHFELRRCANGDEPVSPPGSPGAAAGAAAAFVPRECDVLLMLSGRELGLMKPCGCSEPQRGGLPRRAVLWEQARAKAKSGAAISLGSTLGEESLTLNNIKAELHRAALSTIGYAGLLLSADDLSPFRLSVSQPYSTPEETPRPPLNVKLRASGPLASSATVDPILRFQVGDVPVRAVSVVDPTSQAVLQNQWGVADIVVAPTQAIQALTKEPGILVIASHVMREDIAILVGAAKGKADAVIVVDVLGQVAGRTPVRGWTFGRPMLVTFDEKGKEVALVTLDRKGDGWVAGCDSVPLDPVYDEGDSKGRVQVDKLFREYGKRVRAEGLLEAYATFEDGPVSYVGAEACKSCHAAIYDSWKTTKHAIAMETLVTKESEYDPECVRCHSVGWLPAPGGWSRRQSGFQTLAKTPALANVQCENCHGPGSAHVKEPDRKDLFGPRDSELKHMWRDPGRDGCIVCHDPDNSVHFADPLNYENVYRPQVDHGDVDKALRTVKPK